MIPDVKIGEELICPVCGKIFKATEKTKYIIKGGYTCSWKCFFVEATKRCEAKLERNKKIK